MVAPADIADVLKVCILPLQPFAGPVSVTLGRGFTVTAMNLSTVQPFTFVSRKNKVSLPAEVQFTVNCDDVVSPVAINPKRGRDQRYTLPGVTTPTLYEPLSPTHTVGVPLTTVVGDAYTVKFWGVEVALQF
jgi:hypothetical protein